MVFSADNVRDVHVVSGRTKIFVFAAVEDLRISTEGISERCDTSVPTKWTLA